MSADTIFELMSSVPDGMPEDAWFWQYEDRTFWTNQTLDDSVPLYVAFLTEEEAFRGRDERCRQNPAIEREGAPVLRALAEAEAAVRRGTVPSHGVLFLTGDLREIARRYWR